MNSTPLIMRHIASRLLTMMPNSQLAYLHEAKLTEENVSEITMIVLIVQSKPYFSLQLKRLNKKEGLRPFFCCISTSYSSSSIHAL